MPSAQVILRNSIFDSPEFVGRQMEKIAFSVKSGSRDAIFIVDIESEKQDKLDFKLDAIFSVDWSRDGKFLTFIGNNSKQSDVYKYNLETKELENITNDVFTDSDPVWSLNGEKIYFVSDRKNNLTKDLYPKKCGSTIIRTSIFIQLM